MTKYKVLLNKSVKKRLKIIPPKILRSFNEWRKRLEEYPYSEHDGTLTNRKVKTHEGDSPIYKKRFGKFRALYYVSETQQKVFITNLDKREDVYRK